MKKIIPVRCKSPDRVDPEKLIPLQGSLKILPGRERKKLRSSLEDNGILFPAFVWKSPSGKIYQVDGHQRTSVLLEMINEGRKIQGGGLPVVFVEAKNLNRAKELVLYAASQYARVDEAGFFEFVKLASFERQLIQSLPGKISLPELGNLTSLLSKVTALETPEARDLALPKKPRTKAGDLYELGPHRLLCADATNANSLKVVLNGVQGRVCVLTDPPYNVNFHYNVVDDAKTRKEYAAFCARWWSTVAAEVTPTSVILTPGPNNEELYPKPSDRGTWAKPFSKTGASAFHVRLCEPILFYGKFNRRETDLFQYSASQAVDLKELEARLGVREEFAPAKSMELWGDLVRMIKAPTVLDLFAGNGTTLFACEANGRRAVLVEISEAYCDLIVAQWYRFRPQSRIRRNGKTFEISW